MNTLTKPGIVERHFSKAAATYDAAAEVQECTAGLLSNVMMQCAPEIAPGPILEIGCGTGGMTRHLLKALPGRKMHVTDVSGAMLSVCKENLRATGVDFSQVAFDLLDADELNQKSRFSAVVCSFSLHWFADAAHALVRMLDALAGEGYLFLAGPTNGSFPEWRESCAATGSKFTGNALPPKNCFPVFALERGLANDFDVRHIESMYPSTLSFFRGLRSLGADLRLHTEGASMDLLKTVRDLDRRNPNGVKMTYEVCYGFMRAPLSHKV